MTKANTVELTISPAAAKFLGQFITARVNSNDLKNTPLSLVPFAAQRMLKHVRRWRTVDSRDNSDKTICEFPRNEALATFHYTSLFFHPSIPKSKFVNDIDSDRLRFINFALAKVLKSKPGPERQSDVDDHYVLDLHQEYLDGTLPKRIVPPDFSFIFRVKQRQHKRSHLLNTPLNGIPLYLQQLMCKKHP